MHDKTFRACICMGVGVAFGVVRRKNGWPLLADDLSGLLWCDGNSEHTYSTTVCSYLTP